MIGVDPEAIRRGEDRLAFKETMEELGIEVPRSEIAYTVEDAEAVAAAIGLSGDCTPCFYSGRYRRRTGL